MVTTAADYAAQMIAALALADRRLDTGIGSVTRKIIDAVGEVAASATVDTHLLDYQFDVDSKTGSGLDDFVLTFGFTRFAAKRATGLVTFSRPTAADHDYPIPAGTQVSTGNTPQVIFQTVAPAFLFKATSQVDVPVQAVVGGESGNLSAASLTRLATPVDGVLSATTNIAPTTGGTNAETDADLITRFKSTVFRSMAGTEDMYLGTALERVAGATTNDEAATSALVIGATRSWSEQVQVGADGTATSAIPAGNVKYILPNTSFLGVSLIEGSILTPGTHYVFDKGTDIAPLIPPVVRRLGTALDVNGLYDLTYEYVPSCSRNDPYNGITNRIDIWVTGTRALTGTETSYLRRARTFDNVGANPNVKAANFTRLNLPGQSPVVGNFFLQLAYGPIIDFPNVIVAGGVTLTRGTDFWVVHDNTAFGYGPTSLFGLELRAAVAPVENSAFSLSGANAYTFNALPRDVEERVRRWRLVTTDVRAHAAKQVYLTLNFAVMFDPGLDRAQVTSDLSRLLAVFLAQRGFGGTVQVSDLIQAAHNVPGIDNVRFLNSADDPVNFGIQKVSNLGTVLSNVSSGSPARAIDLILADNEVVALFAVNVVPRAQGTFGTL